MGCRSRRDGGADCWRRLMCPCRESSVSSQVLLAWLRLSRTSPSSRRNDPPPHRHALRDGRLPLDRQDLVRRLPAGGQRVGLRLRQGRCRGRGQPDIRPAAGRRERRVPAGRRRRRVRDLRGGLHRRLHGDKRGDARKIRRLLRGCAAQMAAQFGATLLDTQARPLTQAASPSTTATRSARRQRVDALLNAGCTTQSKSW